MQDELDLVGIACNNVGLLHTLYDSQIGSCRTLDACKSASVYK